MLSLISAFQINRAYRAFSILKDFSWVFLGWGGYAKLYCNPSLMWYFLGGKCIWYEFLYFYVKIRWLSSMILNDSAEFSDNIFEDNGIYYIFLIVFPDFFCGCIASFANKKCRKKVDKAEIYCILLWWSCNR